MLKREKKDLAQRANELEEQYKTLLDQFTQLSDKMASIQNKIQNSAVRFNNFNIYFNKYFNSKWFIKCSYSRVFPCLQNLNSSLGGCEDASDERSNEQLREVIKYLRRERDVAQGKFDVAQAETQRLTALKEVD